MTLYSLLVSPGFGGASWTEAAYLTDRRLLRREVRYWHRLGHRTRTIRHAYRARQAVRMRFRRDAFL